MRAQRRRFLQAASAVAIAAAASAARAATTDLVVCCDTTLGRALRAAAAGFAARTGVQVHVFATPPGLILPQLEREVQNDIVVSGLGMLATASESGVIAADAARSGTWRNRLVLAVRGEARGASVDAGPVAVSDVSPASEFDGPAVLAKAGVRPKSVVGAIDTDEVLELLAAGSARVGLLHASDLAADARLKVLAAVPDEAYPPILYGAAVTRLARRPNPDAFVRYLASDEAAAMLRAHGLEKQP